MTVPPGAEHIEAANQSIVPKENARGYASELIFPMALLALSTWYFDYDFLMGICLTLVVFIVMIMVRRTLTVLTASACGTTPIQHAWTQLPYALIAAALAAVGYLLPI